MVGVEKVIGFTEVFHALKQGKRVRRNVWDKGSEIFEQNGKLMYSCRGNIAQEASGDILDWRDMNAKDWCVL